MTKSDARLDSSTNRKTARAPDKGEALNWFRTMNIIRRFEECAEEAYGQGKIGGFLHLYIGEEAIAVGAISSLIPDDEVVTHYRDHGYVLARGSDPKRVMAELFGKSTGLDKGKGGSMHLADVERHLWGGYAVVGGHIPLAVGLALAIQYQKQSRVVACFFGDGATNTPVFSTSLNMAAIWKLPLVFIVENNLYGMGTAVARASSVTDLYKKASAYNITGTQIDGNNVLEVWNAVHEAVEHARDGHGPQFIEALTYRFRGHSIGDPQRYRTKEEVQEAKAEDPITRWRKYLLEMGLASEIDLDRIVVDVNTAVNEAVQFAEASPPPDSGDLYSHVLAEPIDF